MNHHRTRQFLAEMAEPPLVRPKDYTWPNGIFQIRPLPRDLLALGSEAMIAQAKAAGQDRNQRAALADEERSEGRPFPRKRSNPHGE